MAGWVPGQTHPSCGGVPLLMKVTHSLVLPVCTTDAFMYYCNVNPTRPVLDWLGPDACTVHKRNATRWLEWAEWRYLLACLHQTIPQDAVLDSTCWCDWMVLWYVAIVHVDENLSKRQDSLIVRVQQDQRVQCIHAIKHLLQLVAIQHGWNLDEEKICVWFLNVQVGWP